MELLWPTAAKTPTLGHDDAHAWAVSLELGENPAERYWSVLSEDERRRADEFRIESARRQFVITRGALRILLGQYLNVEPAGVGFSVEAIGKPRLANEYDATNVSFNVSHSGELALIAVTRGCDAGIDVERFRPVKHLEQLAKRYFHPREIETVLATPAAERNAAFLNCWTAKEAVLKAFGTGIAGCLDGFAVSFGESFAGWVDLSGLRKPGKPTECWLQRFEPAAGYPAAIAFLGARRNMGCFTFAL
jgi:4'-phosphopantetheinyl transferase